MTFGPPALSHGEDALHMQLPAVFIAEPPKRNPDAGYPSSIRECASIMRASLWERVPYCSGQRISKVGGGAARWNALRFCRLGPFSYGFIQFAHELKLKYQHLTLISQTSPSRCCTAGDGDGRDVDCDNGALAIPFVVSTCFGGMIQMPASLLFY